ncbi:MAG: Nif11-like leader peptide family RiPP precursor [Schwartzia sp.]|nr:Nif11-like leader peptide family RiPP precursor [Schwartzia sp. (in: firmicutes)]
MKADKEKLLRKIWEDDEFAKKLMEIDDGATMLKFINENGINVTEEDLKEIVEKASKVDWTKETVKGVALPDELLDNVAGGSKIGDFFKDVGKGIKYAVCKPARAYKQLFTGDWDGIAKGAEEVSTEDFFDHLLGHFI